MGNASAHARSIPISQQSGDLRERLQEDLPKFIYIERLSNGKFLKSYRCKVDGVGVVLKAYVRRDPDEDLSPVIDDLKRIAAALPPEKYPHALPYQRWLLPQASVARQLPRPAYLVRQHVLSNLYDRLSTRPFLAPIEQRWIVYQLLCAVAQCHSAGICHGDIKSENVLVTSWNWVLLTDFAPFKPTYLPDDQPAEVDYYFHARESRRCYLAPERLYSPAQQEQSNALSLGNRTTSSGALDSLLDSRLQSSMMLDASLSVSSPTKGSNSQIGPIQGLNSRSKAVTIPVLSSRKNSIVADSRRVGPLKESMDIFSLGCVIAEVFLDGEGPLDLPELLDYRAASDPTNCLKGLAKVEDPTVQKLVRHMLQRDPERRRSAQEYLNRMSENEALFPSFFGNFLNGIMVQLHSKARTPDQRILLICSYYEEAMIQLAGVHDPQGAKIFRSFLEQSDGEDNLAEIQPFSKGTDDPQEMPQNSPNTTPLNLPLRSKVEELLEQSKALIASMDPTWRPSVDLKNKKLRGASLARDSLRSGVPASADGNGLVILAQVVCSSLRHLRRAGVRLLAVNLLVKFGQHCGDEARLQRLVPNLVSLLEDPIPSVRAYSVRGLALLLSMVTSFPPSDANIFSLYIFPAVQRLPQDSEEMVRAAFAEVLPSLAETSKRFLDVAHAMKLAKAIDRQVLSTGCTDILAVPDQAENNQHIQGGNEGGAPCEVSLAKPPVIMINAGYDRELSALRSQITHWLVILASPPPSDVITGERGSREASEGASPRLSLASGVARFCGFFGQDGTLSTLLPQLITFLNDRKCWSLRTAFCRHIAAVCMFVGKVATAKFVLPCIDNALADIEEIVVGGALRCLRTLVELNLLTTYAQLETMHSAMPLLHHPSVWIREAALGLAEAVSRVLGTIDTAVFLLPLVMPFLEYSVLGSEICASTLRQALAPPLSRTAFNLYLAELCNRSNGSSFSNQKSPDSGLSDSTIDFCEDAVVLPNKLPSLEGNNRTSWVANRALSGGEKLQLEAMKGYMEGLARNLSGGRGGLKSASSELEWKLSRDGLMKYGENISERFASALFIPHQRNAPPRPSLELSVELVDGVHRWSKPEVMVLETGVQTSRAQAVRLLSSTSPSTVDEDYAMNSSSDFFSDQTQWSTSVLGSTIEFETQSDRLFNGMEPKALLARARALNLPPLPPDLGRISPIQEVWNMAANSPMGRLDWRPKQGGLVASLREHTGPVNKLVVAQDNTFFASASSDGSCKVWELRGLEQSVRPRSQVTYNQQSGKIMDACIIENTHSIASVSTDGSIHIWRVDLASNGGGSTEQNNGSHISGPRVIGSSTVKKVSLNEGPIFCVNHFNTDVASVVVYATQRGRIHSWDLRCNSEPWTLQTPPELGSLTSLALGTDKNWICGGTNRGYIPMWDIRFPIMSRLWRHSTHGRIQRLSTCARLPVGVDSNVPASQSQGFGPYLFVAAGDNETAVWDLRGDQILLPRYCFRVSNSGEIGQKLGVPTLHRISLPSHTRAPLLPTKNVLSEREDNANASTQRKKQNIAPMRAIVGRISHQASSYLITGGTDRHIRFWDFQTPSRCYTVSGNGMYHVSPTMQPNIECINIAEHGDFKSGKGGTSDCTLTVFTPPPSASDLAQAHLTPMVSNRGVTVASTAHEDAITDLKCADLPMKLLLSSSRDGVVNIWR